MSSELFAPPPPPKNCSRTIPSTVSTRRHSGIPPSIRSYEYRDKWESLGMGSMDKESSFRLLDAFFDAGGNFIDTANN